MLFGGLGRLAARMLLLVGNSLFEMQAMEVWLYLIENLN